LRRGPTCTGSPLATQSRVPGRPTGYLER
jgi:hypothetical protein